MSHPPPSQRRASLSRLLGAALAGLFAGSAGCFVVGLLIPKLPDSPPLVLTLLALAFVIPCAVAVWLVGLGLGREDPKLRAPLEARSARASRAPHLHAGHTDKARNHVGADATNVRVPSSRIRVALALVGVLVGVAVYFGAMPPAWDHALSLLATACIFVAARDGMPSSWWGALSADGRRKRWLRKKAQIPIASVQIGEMVKVVGIVVPRGDLVHTPFTGRPCVAYQLNVAAEGGEGPVPVFEDTDNIRFDVRDETGIIAVDALPASLVTREVVRGRHREASSFDAYITGRRDSGKYNSQLLAPNNLLHVEERLIAPGMTIAVYGVVEEGRQEGSRFQIAPPPRGTAILCDDPSAWSKL
ncbi:MAG: hypothetical protein ABW133_05095 [Polyangiaceae bacterium]